MSKSVFVNPDLNYDQTSNFSTFVDILRARANNQPEKIAYSFLHNDKTEEINLTFKELDMRAKAIAYKLQDMQISGERALLIFRPGLEFIVAFFACLYAGVVAVPVYPPKRNQKMLRLQAIVTDTQAKLALTSIPILNSIERRFSSYPELVSLLYVATETIDRDLASQWQQSEKINSDTLAFLQYTSGSTGTPKGVMISHRNLLHNEQMIKQAFGHNIDTTVVGWLPLHHDMGLIGNVLQPMYLGTSAILMSPIAFLQKPIRWLQAISRYKATTSGGPNFAYDLCVKKVRTEQKQLVDLDLSSWEVAFVGAEPVQAETLQQFAKKFGRYGFQQTSFYPCYGMAETTLLVSGGLKKVKPNIRWLDKLRLSQDRVQVSIERKERGHPIVGCGKSWSNQKIVIVNHKSLEQCRDKQIGEIWVSGASIAQGYWNKSTKTKDIFNGYLTETGEGPFLRTGDLGFIDDGELFVTGRIKDVIIVRGQNHYPNDIELTVQRSHIALRDHCGAAFLVKEAEGIERLIIVQEIERNYIRQLNVNEVVECINEAVAAEHGLQVYAMTFLRTGSISKTSSGKIRRYACRAEFLSNTLNVIGSWSRSFHKKTNF